MSQYKRLSDYKPLDPNIRVGGDVDTLCNRCHMVLNHTILAMQGKEPVRVMCNTCKSQHNYRSKTSHVKRASKRKNVSKKTDESKAKRTYLDAAKGKDLSNPVIYHPSQTYQVDQAILHGKFGEGIVLEVKVDSKIVVAFKDATRMLVHARGEAPGSTKL